MIEQLPCQIEEAAPFAGQPAIARPCFRIRWPLQASKDDILATPKLWQTIRSARLFFTRPAGSGIAAPGGLVATHDSDIGCAGA
jgi:hypothetical protein